MHSDIRRRNFSLVASPNFILVHFSKPAQEKNSRTACLLHFLTLVHMLVYQITCTTGLWQWYQRNVFSLGSLTFSPRKRIILNDCIGCLNILDIRGKLHFCLWQAPQISSEGTVQISVLFWTNQFSVTCEICIGEVRASHILHVEVRKEVKEEEKRKLDWVYFSKLQKAKTLPFQPAI